MATSNAECGEVSSRPPDAARHDDTLARLRGPHAVGKPCPRQSYMMVTTLDIERGRCGACGNVIGGLAARG